MPTLRLPLLPAHDTSTVHCTCPRRLRLTHCCIWASQLPGGGLRLRLVFKTRAAVDAGNAEAAANAAVARGRLHPDADAANITMPALFRQASLGVCVLPPIPGYRPALPQHVYVCFAVACSMSKSLMRSLPCPCWTLPHGVV